MGFEKFKKSVPMSLHTTLRTGGPAAFFAEVHTVDELIKAIRMASSLGRSWRVIGHGSNILVSDRGVKEVIIAFKSDLPPLILGKDQVEVSAGYPLSQLVNFLADNGLSAIEDLAGIPGTVGGAVAGNAGAYGTTIGDSVSHAFVLKKDGKIVVMKHDDFNFEYRNSCVKETADAILKVVFDVRPAEATALKDIAQLRTADRLKKHPDPMRTATAGSYFKNPLDESGKRIAAGKLLEAVGCRELNVGHARTWDAHANIIVTDGTASSKEIKGLADEMAKRVETEFGTKLIPEVTYLD